MKLAVLAALPQELSGSIKQLKAVNDKTKPQVDIYRASYASSEVVLAITGMGSARAESAAEYICKEFRPDLVISIGYGGALYDGAGIGDLVWGSRFISFPELNEATAISNEGHIYGKLAAAVAIKQGAILTLPKLTNKAELLAKLPEGISSPVCDMETFALARICFQGGVRFIALRSITDLKNEDIPSELMDISDEAGNYSITAAMKIFVSNPGLLPAAISLGINSQKASRNLTLAVNELLKVIL